MDARRPRPVGLGLVAGLARAIRAEFGPGMDHEYPGRIDPAEAGPVNRAYRAAASHALEAVAHARGVPPIPPVEAVAAVARRRLAAEGLGPRQVEALLAREPGPRPDWAAFLSLTTADRLRDLLADDARGPA